ncbi:peroxidase family protein [Minwuia sp.]|uniref:peroxidase family protein n=1 Tax=Minwuia sp. TaxID=2493630 RepID=UPI003A94CD8F
MISDSLRNHACRQHQSKMKGDDKGSGPAVNPDIYVGVECRDNPGHTDIKRTISLFSYLNERMQQNYPWSEKQTPYNPNIPSGYTYLGQLASHDLFVGDSTAPSLRDPAKTKNERSRPLALETLYGRTPELDSKIFERASNQPGVRFAHWPRTRFRLDGVGHAVNDWSRDSSRCPRRDIGRIREVRFSQEYGCPLVADDRNDDHAILSQLTALLQLTHNTVLDLIEWSEKPSDPLDSANNFVTARNAVIFVYRKIVRHDLLAHLLDPAVRKYYEQSNDPGRFVLDPPKGSVLTPDFLNAAYRVGHAMVRSEYDFGAGRAHNFPEIMRNSSFRMPRQTPLQFEWIVRWARFFEITGVADKPQHARRISPKYVAALHDQNLFPAGDDAEPVGLAYRDLLRAATSGVLKIEALARMVCDRSPELASTSPWISDVDVRRKALRTWIAENASESVEAFKDEFVNNPPPNIYYLLEAAVAAKGQHVGPLGSIVLAETFFRALDEHHGEEEQAASAAEVFGPDIPQSMDQLIRWVNQHMHVEDKVFGDQALPLI